MGGQAPQAPERTPVLLGLDLLRTTGALLRQHWVPLMLIALCAAFARFSLMDLVVWIARQGALPGFLALSLVPFVPLVAVVAMLLLLRRRRRNSTPFGDMLAAIASVLVPFLVVYQGSRGLDDDLVAYAYEGWRDDMSQVEDFSEATETVSRIPLAESLTVIAVVVAAVLIRLFGAHLVRTRSLWRGPEDPRRMGTQIVVGYAEIVWVVLGAYVVTYVVRESRSWLQAREVTRWMENFQDWIAGFWPQVDFVLPIALDWLGRIGAGAVAGILVPTSWLAIGVIVYGTQAADLVRVEDLVRLRRTSPFFAKVVEKVGLVPIVRAWKLLTNPDGRFGALVGAGAMILKVGWTPILTFCIVYVAVSQLPLLIWQLVGRLFSPLSQNAWAAISDPVSVILNAIVLVVSTALLAASADALLSRFGAPSWLRLPGPRPESLDQLPLPKAADLIAARAPVPSETAGAGPGSDARTGAGEVARDASGEAAGPWTQPPAPVAQAQASTAPAAPAPSSGTPILGSERTSLEPVTDASVDQEPPITTEPTTAQPPESSTSPAAELPSPEPAAPEHPQDPQHPEGREDPEHPRDA